MNPYEALRRTMRTLNAEIARGEARYALTIRGDGIARWEQVAGRPYDMERIHFAVARRLGFA